MVFKLPVSFTNTQLFSLPQTGHMTLKSQRKDRSKWKIAVVLYSYNLRCLCFWKILSGWSLACARLFILGHLIITSRLSLLKSLPLASSAKSVILFIHVPSLTLPSSLRPPLFKAFWYALTAISSFLFLTL